MTRRFRHFATVALALTAVALAIAGCAAPPITDMPDGPAGSTFADNESPMLTRLVEEGKLPALAQRLPSDPLVVRPLDSLGEYGGTWHTMVDDPDMGMYLCVGGYCPLMRWRADCNGIEPGLATDWEFNSDGTALTIHLRHGVKWSDGAPYTSADLAYWMDVCATGKSETTYPYWSLVDKKPPSYSCPNKYTFVMKFAGPDWYVPYHMATGFWECGAYQMPKRYLIQFDPRYNHHYKDFEVLDEKKQFSFNPDLPTLCPWRLTAIENGGFRMVLERNPYYYMVDTAGRQLPYVDKIIVEYVPDPQIRVLKVLSGEIDAQFYDEQLADIDLYVRGEKTGRYRVLKWNTGAGADEAFMVNWSPPDPVLRKIFRDVRFRKALSLAIDREKINQLALQGLDHPQQATISREAWHFNVPGGRNMFDDWAKAYSEFDIPKANKLLDEMGLTKRDAEGYRLRPDGQRFSLLIDLLPAATEDISVDETQTVADGWRALGIDVSQHNFSAAQFNMRQVLGTFEISPLGESEMDLFTYPDWVFPVTEDRWHGAVGKWYASGGKQGEAPTGVCKQLVDIYNQIMAEKDLAKAHQLVLKAIRLETQEGFFCLGTVGQEPGLVTIKVNMRNIPPSNRMLGPWAVASPATSFPETFYFSSGATAPAPPSAPTGRS